MTTSRFRHIHLVLIVGISLIIPFLLAYSLYVNLSETILLSSDMSLEDSDDEDLSSYQDEFKVFEPQVLSSPSFIGTHLGPEFCRSSSPLISSTEKTPVLRC